MKKYFHKIILTACALTALLSSAPAFAQGGSVTLPASPASQITDAQLGLNIGAATGLSPRDPRLTAMLIIRAVLGILGILTVAFILFAGFLWMTAGGNDEKIGQAKGWIYSAAIGLAIILSAYGIANFVVNSLLKATGFGVIQLF